MFTISAPGRIKLDVSIDTEQELERINQIVERIIQDGPKKFFLVFFSSAICRLNPLI